MQRGAPRPAFERLSLRIGLLGAGGLLLQTSASVFATGLLIQSPLHQFAVIGAGLGGLAVCAGAGLRNPAPTLRWLIVAAFIAKVLLSAATWVGTSGATWIGQSLPHLVQTDSAIYTDLAGALILQGYNPYTWDFAGAMTLYRAGNIASTPTLAGADESPYPYPALPFLLSALLQWAGLPGTYSLIVAAYILSAVLLFIAAPRAAQPAVILLAAIGAALDPLVLSFIGVMDMVWVAMLVAAVLGWRSPALRAICFGLAVAFKQGPWLLLPFLLVRLWRAEEEGGSPRRRVQRFAAISATTFLLVNGPFLLADPGAWLRGVTEPLLDNLVFLSQGGFSGLTQYGFLNLPRSYYLIASLTILALLLFIYWRHYNALRDALWMMPALYLWFPYRSLPTYWLYWIFPALAVVLRPAQPPGWGTPKTRQSFRGPRWRPTAIAAGGTLAALGALGAALVSPAPVVINLRAPLLVGAGGRVIGLSAQVHNAGARALTPRFAVQHTRTSTNPVYWRIEQGPRSLKPGESAVYQLSARGEAGSFYPHEGGQLVVTDAGGDYALRGVATVAPERSILWPDRIPNPGFRFWDAARSGPLYWLIQIAPPGCGAARMAQAEGRAALLLALDPCRAEATPEGRRITLETHIPFAAGQFTVWGYLDPPGASTAPFTVGLEIDDGKRTTWFLFSGSPAGDETADRRIIRRPIPPRQWTPVKIDVPATYSNAGWPIPAPERVTYRGVTADFRLIALRLFIMSDSPLDMARAYFGPIEQTAPDTTPEGLMAETLADPVGYYARLGDSAIALGNYHRAIEAYEAALRFAPGKTDAADIAERLRRARRYLEQEYAR